MGSAINTNAENKMQIYTPSVYQDAVITPRGRDGNLVFLDSAQNMIAEQFRVMSARLRERHPTGGVMMVTSPASQDGKTITAINLAFGLAERGSSVLLLELDLRRPSIRNALGIVGISSGVEEVLRGDCTPESVIRTLGGTQLSVATASGPVTDVRELIQGDSLRKLLQWARQRFHWVILDTPPVFPIADASELARLSSIVVLVVRARHTPAPLVQRSVDLLAGRLHYTVMNESSQCVDSSSRYMNAYEIPNGTIRFRKDKSS
ncbi:MAG: CpsD/CapB family tyrosine-protein kinase [Acidobacteriaceae bacterium]